MRTWVGLYAMVWVALLEFLVLMFAPGGTLGLALHIGIGLLILGLAQVNFRNVRASSAPMRIKRISKATANLSIGQLLIGLLLAARIDLWGLTVLAHLLVAFAIITQAASTATAYDMWEEKEFGEVPKPVEPPVSILVPTTPMGP